jgi:hypothetical protein
MSTSPNYEANSLTVHTLMHAVFRVAMESATFTGGSASHTTQNTTLSTKQTKTQDVLEGR